MTAKRLNPVLATTSGNASVNNVVSGADNFCKWTRYGNIVTVYLWAKISSAVAAWGWLNLVSAGGLPTTAFDCGFPARLDGNTTQAMFFLTANGGVNFTPRNGTASANQVYHASFTYVCK